MSDIYIKLSCLILSIIFVFTLTNCIFVPPIINDRLLLPGGKQKLPKKRKIRKKPEKTKQKTVPLRNKDKSTGQKLL